MALGFVVMDTGINLVCMPGTHSKWVRTDDAGVREFHTAMTGELFDVITQHTLFAG
jgi:2-dehydro-3-deoxygalactonokinase